MEKLSAYEEVFKRYKWGREREIEREKERDIESLKNENELHGWTLAAYLSFTAVSEYMEGIKTAQNPQQNL